MKKITEERSNEEYKIDKKTGLRTKFYKKKTKTNRIKS